MNIEDEVLICCTFLYIILAARVPVCTIYY